MSAKQPGPDGKKRKGWFSWRHETDEANREARERYMATRGRAARQRRAQERSEAARS